MQQNIFQHLLSNWDDVATGAGAIFILSSAIRTMPNPPTNSVGYAWLYRFCQIIVANWDLTTAQNKKADAAEKKAEQEQKP